MNIKQPTQDILVVSTFSILPYFVAIIFSAVGFYTIFFPTVEEVPLLVSIIFILSGFGVVAILQNPKTTFDKTKNFMRVERRSLFNKKAEAYQLDQIKEVIVTNQHTSTRTKGTFHSGRGAFNLVVQFKDNSAVTIGTISTGNLRINGLGVFQLFGKKIADPGISLSQFLGVPYHEIRPPSIGEVIQSVKNNMGKNN